MSILPGRTGPRCRLPPASRLIRKSLQLRVASRPIAYCLMTAAWLSHKRSVAFPPLFHSRTHWGNAQFFLVPMLHSVIPLGALLVRQAIRSLVSVWNCELLVFFVSMWVAVSPLAISCRRWRLLLSAAFRLFAMCLTFPLLQHCLGAIPLLQQGCSFSNQAVVVCHVST